MVRSIHRERLIDTAIDLFCKHGYHAVGVNRILASAGVSKKTLYTHFRSKDELIIAALRHYDGVYRNDFMRRVARAGDTPRQRLIAVYEVARESFLKNRFLGCMFINAVGEYSQSKGPVRAVAKQFKALTRDYIRSLCAEAGAPDPDRLADQLALLLEGAIVTSQVSQEATSAQTAKEIATILIEGELGAEQGSSRQ